MTKGGTGSPANGHQYSGTEAERLAMPTADLNFNDQFYEKLNGKATKAFYWDKVEWVHYMNFDV